MDIPLRDELLEIIVCPIDHGALIYVRDSNVLYNPRLRKAFDVKEGIPILLEEEAHDIDDDTHSLYIKDTHGLN